MALTQKRENLNWTTIEVRGSVTHTVFKVLQRLLI